MAVYLALMLAPLAIAAASLLPPRPARLVWAAVWLGLVLFVGLRRELAADWDNYLLMYRRAGAYPLAEAATLSDPGYMLLSGLLARLGLAVPALNLVCAALFATGLLRFARSRPMPALAMLVAVPVAMMLAALMSPRQAVALGLLMWALAAYGEGKRLGPALLLLGALAFHWTALLLLPVAAAMHWPRLPAWTLPAAGAAAGLAVAAALQFVPALAEQAGHVAASRGAWFRAVPTIAALALLAALRGWLGLDAVERRLAAGLSAAALFAVALLPVLPAAGDRLGFYAVPLQMIVFARAAVLPQGAAARLAASSAIALAYGAMFATWLAMTPYRGCLAPYRSYLAEPGAMVDPAFDRHRRRFTCMEVPSAAGAR